MPSSPWPTRRGIPCIRFSAFETQPFVTANYTIFVAEVASTMNERLLLRKLLETITDPKERFVLRAACRRQHRGTFYTQVLFADFRTGGATGSPSRTTDHGRRFKGDLWTMLRDYYGEAVASDELYRYTLDADPRTSTTLRIMFYQYATCFASSAANLFKALNTAGGRSGPP